MHDGDVGENPAEIGEFLADRGEVVLRRWRELRGGPFELGTEGGKVTESTFRGSAARLGEFGRERFPWRNNHVLLPRQCVSRLGRNSST